MRIKYVIRKYIHFEDLSTVRLSKSNKCIVSHFENIQSTTRL